MTKVIISIFSGVSFFSERILLDQYQIIFVSIRIAYSYLIDCCPIFFGAFYFFEYVPIQIILKQKSDKKSVYTKHYIIPFFFRLKHIISLKNLPSPQQVRVCTTGFGATFAAVFLNYWLREFLLSAFANRFELRCEPKQLMLLSYKICPYTTIIQFNLRRRI